MRYALLAGMGLGALSLGACGGASVNAVAQAADRTAATGGEHLTLSGTVTEGGLTSRVEGVGDYQNSPPLGHLQMSVAVGTKAVQVDEIDEGSTGYLRSDVFSSLLPHGKEWLLIRSSSLRRLGLGAVTASQQSPTQTLRALGTSDSATKVGTATVDGVPTTHYRLKTPKLLVGTTDVWIGSDHLVRRIELTSTRYHLRMDFSRFGESVTVHKPQASETLDMSKLGGNP